MKKTINVTAPTREQAFDVLIRFCWFKAQKYSALGVDSEKCKLKPYKSYFAFEIREDKSDV